MDERFARVDARFDKMWQPALRMIGTASPIAIALGVLAIALAGSFELNERSQERGQDRFRTGQR